MKIRPVAAELNHADGQTDRLTDGQTDMTKLIVASCNFSNASETRILRARQCTLTKFGRVCVTGSGILYRYMDNEW